jgi:hypothetical protein
VGRETKCTALQVSHNDFPNSGDANDAAICFTSLEEKSGMFLQVWTGDSETEEEGTIVYIPFGTLLMLPKYCIHGGGFAFTLDADSRVTNSYRMHLYVWAGVGASENNNVYSFPNGTLMSEIKTPPSNYSLMEPLFS